jgi:membrane associated rhomboid family serine protease
MARYPQYGGSTVSIGPGRWTFAVKVLIITNLVVFLVSLVVPALVMQFGVRPAAVLEQLAVYQLVTYMFLHGGIGHLLFNMLALWMFGTELERTWGTRFFTKYYFVTGIGAALITLVWSLSPLPFADALYYSLMIGASGAVYGVLLAYALWFPNRPILLSFLFPIPAKYFVMIIGAITFLNSVGAAGSGVAHTAHLGGLVVGYFYLRGLRGWPLDEIRYRWLRWKMNRARGRFDVYSGGRRDDDDWKSDWKKHIH